MNLIGTLLRAELAVRGDRIVGSAVEARRQGRPDWEVALLNHLTGSLAERSHGTIQVRGNRFRVDSYVSDFHQKGPYRQDLYGADLAVAVGLKEPNKWKYALFQLKLACPWKGYVDLRKDQLIAASVDPEVRDRTFVAAVDRRGEVSASSLKTSLPASTGRSPPEGFD